MTKTFAQLPDTGRAKLGLADITEICQLYEQGLSLRRIAERLKLNLKTVFGILKQRWYTDVPRRNEHGEWVWDRPPVRPNIKLTDDDVRKVFELRAQGWPQWAIAKAVGCTRSNVSVILRGKSRRTVARCC